jgi:D-sedoheptulose 7-phosphate isomerase
MLEASRLRRIDEMGAEAVSPRAVFLDRDGVINAYAYNPEFGTVDSPANPAEFALLPGAAEAIARLNEAGLLAIVVSNQPGIAKGRFTPKLLEAITEKMKGLVAQAGGKLDGVYYCFHHPEGTIDGYRRACECRKPNPGLLHQAAREWGIDLRSSYMVGDGVVDVLAGRQAGTRTVFLSPRKGYVYSELERQHAWPDWIAGNLPEAVELIRNAENGHGLAPGGTSARREDSSEGPGYTAVYVQEAIAILQQIDHSAIERMAELLVELRERGGRLFFLGVGGGAGHASHAVNDFRKIAGIEAYTPTDNVSELTARINDDGWETSYANWLRGSRLKAADMLFVFSVGGGDVKRNISANLVRALEYAKQVGATICGVVGRDGGFTRQVADGCVVVPVANAATVTPHTESFQALVWHLLVSHPKLKVAEMKWESAR